VSASGPLLVLSRSDLEALLPPERCIQAVEAAMVATSRGDSVLPLRTSTDVPGTGGRLILMPGCVTGTGVTDGSAPTRAFGVKVVAKFARPAGDPLGTHVGAVLLFCADTGRLLALLEGGTLTALRTAAASALATRVLARADADVVAILGTGEEAFRHAIAMCSVRPVRELRVWGRTPSRAEALVPRIRTALGAHACGRTSAAAGTLPEIHAIRDVPAAVGGASIVCTTTSAREPILRGEWLDPGTHVNLVGSAIPTTAEVDHECVRRARFYVDYRPSAAAEAGELRAAIAAGVIDAEHVLGEIGEVLLGRVAGRSTDSDITVYKSLGISAQDLAAAAWALSAAGPRRGTRVDLGA
jgi:ornithine cyclodeaminase/alanine dehydrogenase-like protein (mu-crystallin family)